MEVKEKISAGRVVIAAGRRVDPTDATVPRFPASRVAAVRNEVQKFFGLERPLALVCSAACGADLIALDLAGSQQIERHILLPTEPEDFRRTSVTDRPGNWGEIYDRMLEASIVEVLKVPEGQEGYLETSLELLDRGEALAREYSATPEALVIWDKRSRGPDDVTAYFLSQARLRGIEVVEIATWSPAA